MFVVSISAAASYVLLGIVQVSAIKEVLLVKLIYSSVEEETEQ